MPPLSEKIKPGIAPLPDGAAACHAHVLIATWFGSGRLRPAPGTMGSLAAIPFGCVIAYFGGPVGLLVAAIILFFVGAKSADYFGAKSGVKDDQRIVVDEVIGLWIAAIPAGIDWKLWLGAFILFRLFDIYKPWPASYFDRRARSGYDVLLDDVIAGIYAFLGVATLALLVAR